MGKIVKSVARLVVIGAATAIGTLVGGPLGGRIGLLAGSMLSGSVLNDKKKAPAPTPTQLSRLQARLDTQAPRKMVLGTTAFPADIRYYEGSGEDERVIEYIIAVAAHRVREISELWIEDELAWSAAGGIAPQFIDYLGVEGYTEGRTDNTRAINGGARWGSDDRLTGCAYLYVRVNRLGATENEQSPFANGLPGRVTIVGEGMPMYDPRFDSTRGGSGSMRVDNQNTWGPSTGNPIIQSLNVLLGWRINGKLSVGAGIPAKYINFDSVITAANACDEDIVLSGGGTQPRYRTAGAFSTDDAPMNIVGALLAGCAGDLLDSDGQLSFLIKTNTLAVPAVTFDDHDIVSAGRWDPMGGQTNLPNIISGNFTDPSDRSLYQPVPYPSVRLDSEDGIERTAPVDLPVVENAPQAERLAKQTLQRMQYPGLFSAEYNMKGMAAKVGSIVWQSYSPRGWLNKPFRVVSQKPSRSGRIALVLREEHEDIYAWEAEDSAPVQPAEPVGFDFRNTGPILLAREASKTANWSKIVNDDGNQPEDNATRNQSRGNYSASATYLPGDMVVWTVASGGDGAGYTRIGAGETTGVAPSNTSKWALTVQRGQQGVTGSPGAPGAPGADGAPGAPATSAYLTNESATVWAYADGNVSGYGPATGQFKIFAGATDISGSFALSTVANPQGLTVDYTGQTYTISGGLDPNEDTAALTIRATGSGAYAGKTFDKVFSLAKTRGGYEIVTGLPSTNLFDGRQIWDQSDGKLKIYKASIGWRPQIDVDSAINGAKLDPRTVTIEKLLVSPSNLVQNSDFSKGFEGWFPAVGTAYQSVVTTNVGPSKNLLNFAHPGGGASEFSAIYASAIPHSDANTDSAGFEVREGEQYNISVYVARSGTVTGSFQVRCYLLNVDGTTTTAIYPINISAAGFTQTWSSANLLTGTLTIPAGAYRCIPLIVMTGWTQGEVRCSKLRITRKADADLIVDGSILARNMAAESVTTDKLQAGAVTAGKLNVTALSAITADLGTVTAGRIVFNQGGFMRVQGLGFGSANQFFEWFGPTQSNISNCTEANAITYIKTDGSAYFGGSLSAGDLRNSAQTSVVDANASVQLGPFGSNGNAIQVVASYFLESFSETTYPNNSTGFNNWNAACAAWGATGYTGGTVSASKPFSCSVVVRVDRNGAAGWGTLTISGGTETLTGTRPEVGGNSGYLRTTRTVSGSITKTDNAGGTTNRTFVATITTRSGATIGAIQQQRVSLISVEET
jgi:hypothetical protein